MKHVAISIYLAIIAVLSYGTLAKAEAPTPPPPPTLSGVTSDVDGIEVPIEILIDLQMEFQGQAVNQAKRVRFGVNEAYRLRIDRDSLTNDYDKDTRYIYYDMSWKRLDEQALKVPETVKVEDTTEVYIPSTELNVSNKPPKQKPSETLPSEEPHNPQPSDEKPKPKPESEPSPDATTTQQP